MQTLSQHQDRRALYGDAAQDSCVPRSGIDIDPIVTNIRMWHRRVTMNDEFSMVVRRIQEFLANP